MPSGSDLRAESTDGTTHRALFAAIISRPPPPPGLREQELLALAQQKQHGNSHNTTQCTAYLFTNEGYAGIQLAKLQTGPKIVPKYDSYQLTHGKTFDLSTETRTKVSY